MHLQDSTMGGQGDCKNSPHHAWLKGIFIRYVAGKGRLYRLVQGFDPHLPKKLGFKNVVKTPHYLLAKIE